MNDKKKWLGFGLGVSPLLYFVFVFLTDVEPDRAIALFFGSIFYFIVGMIISLIPSKPFNRGIRYGVITGVLINALLLATTC